MVSLPWGNLLTTLLILVSLLSILPLSLARWLGNQHQEQAISLQLKEWDSLEPMALISVYQALQNLVQVPSPFKLEGQLLGGNQGLWASVLARLQTPAVASSLPFDLQSVSLQNM